ncbi:MAG: Zn-ribbon domain-containing OB-fold protein [Thermoplasmata archaeon]
MAVPRFWREIGSRYNFQASKCRKCGKIFFPPRDMCSECRRASIGMMQDIQLPDEGKILSYTTIHNGPEAFKMQIPYTMAIIEIDGGVRLTSQIVDCDPSKLRIGMKVKSVFRRIGEDGKAGMIYYGYKFKPME